MNVCVRYEGTLCLSTLKNILSALKVKGGKDGVDFSAGPLKYLCVLKATIGSSHTRLLFLTKSKKIKVYERKTRASESVK